MSFSPRNVSQLLVASATADQLTAVGDYVITVIPNPDFVALDGGYENLGARIQVKTTGGTKVSDLIPAGAKYTAATAAVAAAQVVTATYPAVSNSTTYVAKVILHDHIGSMLNERFVNSYVVLDSDGAFIKSDGTKQASATLAQVLTELASQLQASLDRSNEGYTVTATATTIVVTGAIPPQRVGAQDGIANYFSFSGGTKDNISGVDGAFFTEAAVAVLTTPGKAGDLTQLKNIEWFNSGYDKDAYREVGHFASFEADSNLTAAAVSATTDYGIFQFHKDRDATNVERQHRQLIVVGAGAATLGAAVGFTAGTATGV